MTEKIPSTSLRAMRDELQKMKKGRGVPITSLFLKVATEGHGPPPHQYEEMNKAKWKQTLKDIPIAILGTGAGYGLGYTASEYLLPHIFKTEGAQAGFKKVLPAVSAAAGGLGSYMLAVQRRMLKERREEAARNAAQQPQQPQQPQEPKTAGMPAPAIARAKKSDPWREDNRNPPFLL